MANNSAKTKGLRKLNSSKNIKTSKAYKKGVKSVEDDSSYGKIKKAIKKRGGKSTSKTQQFFKKY